MIEKSLVATLAITLLASVGCTPAAPPPGGPEDDPLLTSLQVTTAPGRVGFTLQVTNVSGAPVELNFNSGQSAEFVVTRAGERVWRWSDEQGFTQALREEVLQPGESRSYEAEWRPPAGLSGEFTATGSLTAREHRPEQSSPFRLP